MLITGHTTIIKKMLKNLRNRKNTRNGGIRQIQEERRLVLSI